VKDELELHEQVWRRVSSLQDAGANERVFVLITDADGRTTLMFGDGKNGARLPVGTNQITAIYRWPPNSSISHAGQPVSKKQRPSFKKAS
jgi:hypothetical protein